MHREPAAGTQAGVLVCRTCGGFGTETSASGECIIYVDGAGWARCRREADVRNGEDIATEGRLRDVWPEEQ